MNLDLFWTQVFALQIEKVAWNNSEFTTEDTNVKQTNNTTIYNQYLIRNYFKKLLKTQGVKVGFVGSMIFENEGGGAQLPGSKF